MLLVIIVFTILTIILFVAVIWWNSYRVLFQPSVIHNWKPDRPHLNVFLPIDGSHPITDHQETNISNPNPVPGALHGWLVEVPHHRKIILFFHGNDTNISTRRYMVEMCCKLGFNLFLIDYRGYGYSNGKPMLNTLGLDGELAYKFLRHGYAADDIIIWGESLGGYVASYVASKYPCSSLVLMSTFASLPDVIYNLSAPGWVTKSMGFFIRRLLPPLDNKTLVSNTPSPILIIHSVDDERIPFINAEILYDHVPHERKLLVKINGLHAGPIFQRHDMMQIVEFIGGDLHRCYNMNWGDVFDGTDAKVML